MNIEELKSEYQNLLVERRNLNSRIKKIRDQLRAVLMAESFKNLAELLDIDEEYFKN